ncbi:beta and beta-prime subunits of DNA dependent RNA-polymerase [Dichomitus squalens]|uniref:DNA-directed RNA polymerase subunit n=1 Tax=Dichomitus squalens TaxID=114155 RepID=A0A4Q9PVD0_9APHY|nr:beta and beta-prime subunits of DNA dependent RNA-polymerase [Dichomitus squalens]TBU58399.1 beta and beta-prime subunits of DNA dependent RNA-polymerase [Dichomitus squalens]
MNISQPVPSTVASISFSFLTTEDVRRISVKQIVNPVLLDELNSPNIGGLYDPALGPSDKNSICATCRLSYYTCPGHFGHIDLPAPVFHPLFMVNAYHLLRGTCLFCHRFKVSRFVLCKFVAKLRLLEYGFLVAAKALDDIHYSTIKKRGVEDDDDEPAETYEAYEQRINLYVAAHMATASSSKRDAYKDGLVYQARKDVIQDFIKTAMLRKCQNANCNAHGYTFRKEGYTKIIEYDLTIKQKAQHDAMGLRRPNVMLDEQKSKLKSQTSVQTNGHSGDPSDEDTSSDEEEGENVFSNDEEEDEHERPANGQSLPKSASGKVKTTRGRNERVVPPEECRAHLRRLFRNESVMCSLLFGRHGPFAPLSQHNLSLASADMFFLEVLPVSPTRFRPPAKMGDMLFEHPQNELLSKVLTTSYRLRDLNNSLRLASEKGSDVDEAARRRILQSLLDSLIQLQVDVNSYIDSSKNPQPIRQGRLPPAGVKQGLEKKEGLFRKHMMGKRVNYAARSVISPDVNIEPNEIGIPPVFARKLTFPEPVTPNNFHELRQLVITGARGYPGATIVEYEDGHQQFLDKLTLEQRTAIANQLLTPQEGSHGSAQRHGLYTSTPAVNKKVYRHLRDGDILILNRQPTLHKPSMMCHKARVLHGEKTIRMHYANCNSYNADFDGDEMNIHFPQNQVARAEAYYIANTDNQYLVPTSGKPLRGLIQDHVVAGVWMTAQDSFFTREEYFQLLYGALRPEDEPLEGKRWLVTLPPTIWKPQPLWTGKQIISTVMKNITPSVFEGLNLHAQAKVPGHLWGKDSKEDQVVFMDGELLSGVLDKSAFGASDFGLVHSVYELYGADTAGRLLGILSRLFTKFLQHRAFTCRMDDLALTPDGNAKRAELLVTGANLGTEGAMENFPVLKTTQDDEKSQVLRSLLEDVLRDDSKMAGLDVTVKGKLAKLTKSIADAVMPHGLLRQFPHNHMQAMTVSGAKGSAVNAQQISCALGQQELEGRRVPTMVSGKTLPSFKPFETRAMAGGYVASRFLTGVKPQEFFFHCMAGREGLIDTAVKTSRSGYLQRCLIKHLEGIRVHYDNTVRGSDSSVYQFNYGGDSLDVTKQKHLTQFEFIARNEVSFVERLQPKSLGGHVSEDAVDYMKKIVKYKDKKHKRDRMLPTISKYPPQRNVGSTSELFADKVEEYIQKNPHGLIKEKEGEARFKRRRAPLSKKNFRLLTSVKYMRSLVEPGEAVGLLASQGVGEPSTQMTLNTFHFAGHGAANVTLGIPRLREIVMTASQKPKTPSMTMRVRPGTTPSDITSFCKKASRLALSHVVDRVSVTEQLILKGESRSKEFRIDLDFYPRSEYEQEYNVTPLEILASFGHKFPQIFRKELQVELKKLDADLKSQRAELGKGRAVREHPGAAAAEEEQGEEPNGRGRDEDDGASEIGDGDAVTSKMKRQRKEQATYEDDDEEADEGGELDDMDIEAAYASSPEDDAVDSDVDEDAPSMAAEHGRIESSFMDNLPSATSFSFRDSGCTIGLQFGSTMPKLLLVGLVERVCLKTVVREIPGITDCFMNEEDGKNGEKIYSLTTNGSNIPGLWQFARGHGESIIDEDGIYSNDIYALLCAYGVEAARAAILKEIGGVFAVYKIDVDIRHLELIADYMTFDGGYKPFNRKGISTNPSPLLKASYETTAAFLSDATLHGDFDDLTTPSGNIVMGRLSHTGTGVFDIVMPVDQMDTTIDMS